MDNTQPIPRIYGYDTLNIVEKHAILIGDYRD